MSQGAAKLATVLETPGCLYSLGPIVGRLRVVPDTLKTQSSLHHPLTAYREPGHPAGDVGGTTSRERAP